jgi:hypothetical protein
MSSTSSGRSSTPIGRNNPEATVPAADPTAPTVDTAPGRNDTRGSVDASTLIDMTTAGTMPKATRVAHTPVIAKIIALCGFPADSTMVRYIDQQGWTELEHVTSVGVDEIKDFMTVRNDGSLDAKPMLIHLRMFKAFLLYYMRKRRELFTSLTEEDVLDITKTEFKKYCGSVEYHNNVATVGFPLMAYPNPRLTTNATGIASKKDSHEVRQDVESD